VYGKATQLTSPNMPVVAADVDPAGSTSELSPQAADRLRELGVANPTPLTLAPSRARELGIEAGSPEAQRAAIQDTARRIAVTSLWDIGVFFAVLMVGFAYVWRCGDLDWVRSVRNRSGEIVERAPVTLELEPRDMRAAGSVLSA
jgi:NADH-quinone oxidoreductase subunit A